ncbi:unnamed protein product [Cercospora beticola]|nr:unnamed protein product [Cercospora beticola]
MEPTSLPIRPMDLERKSRENHNRKPLYRWIFKLPREIRDHIYSFTMPSSQLIDPITNRFGSFGSIKNAHNNDLYALFHVDEDTAAADLRIDAWSEAETMHLIPERTFALSQVCRALRAETLEIAYGSNVFVLPGSGTADSWTRKMTTRWLESLPEEASDMLVVNLDGELIRETAVGRDPIHLRCVAFTHIKFHSAEANAVPRSEQPPCGKENCPRNPEEWKATVLDRKAAWQTRSPDPKGEKCTDQKVTRSTAMALLDHYWTWL